MVTVTDTAKKVMKTAIEYNKDESWYCFRLKFKEPDDFYFEGVAEEFKGDQVVEHDGVKILLIEDNLAAALEDIEIDFGDTPQGPGLIVHTNA
jgi:Fe-S cluster assembly iron-binding protein IscA